MYGEEKEKYSSPNLPNTPKGVVLSTLLSRASRSNPGRMAKAEGVGSFRQLRVSPVFIDFPPISPKTAPV